MQQHSAVIYTVKQNIKLNSKEKITECTTELIVQQIKMPDEDKLQLYNFLSIQEFSEE